jgi:GR25 family glycosyltransferase involved in LPS biosynthesis
MKSPVLFLVFNRPDTTLKVFESIRLAKPPKLYIAADGPRDGRIAEVKICQEVREIVKNVDWDCEVHTLFRDKNLGCKRGVYEGIDWFFQNEEEGIILEDDVVPHTDFFVFCDFVLNKYRFDERIMMATGTNYLSNSEYKQPYFFSEHFTIWGWATWRRSWSLYDPDMSMWEHKKNQDDLCYKFQNSYIWKHFKNTFDSLKTDYIDTWDIQWVFTCLFNSGLCVTPRVNLITNIGVNGVHSDSVTDSHFLEQSSLNFDFKTDINPNVHVSSEYDNALHMLKTRPALRRKKIINILKKIKLYNLFKRIKNSIIKI